MEGFSLRNIFRVPFLALLVLSCNVFGQAPGCQLHNFQVSDVTLNPPAVVDSYQACNCTVSGTDSNNIYCKSDQSATTSESVTVASAITASLFVNARILESSSLSDSLIASNIPAPNPTPSPSPSPTPSPTLVTITFDPAPTACKLDVCPLNGIYAGINWGTNQWAWGGAFEGFKTNNVFFNNSTGTVRNFSFIGSNVLVSLQATSDASGTLVIATDAGETITKSIPSGILVTNIVTGFTKSAKSVTVTFSQGWHVDFDNIVYQ
jgi:hypothetical protein